MSPMPAPLGLYIHIPFCKSKCVYCDFYSLPRSESRMDDYTDALCAHLAETAPFAAGHLVDTVYFGGGTPSYLGTKLSEIGRVHTMAQTEAAVEAARKAKFQNLSLDLIYGLPHQTLEGWQKNLSAALDLTPEHLSCYGLKVEEGTPLFARRGTAGLPGDDAQADMYLYTVEFLKAQGYEQYEISNFAKPGCASRHNLKDWTLGEYAGFGPGAHSDFGGVRYAYTKDLEGYIRGVRDHAPMLSESDRIPPLDRDTEWVMLGLRTTAGLDPKAFERRFRRRFTCFLPFLDQCARAGYAVEEDGRWHLTPRGFLVSNQIIGGMLDALAADKQRRADAPAPGSETRPAPPPRTSRSRYTGRRPH